MWDTLAWAALVAAVCGLGTAGLILAWDGWVRRETAAARALAEAREEALAAQRRREQAAIEALAASERRHRALAQAGAIAVWRADPDGRLQAVEGWDALTGQAAETVLGRPAGWLLAVVPEDQARAEAAWARARAEASMLDLEVRLRVAGGAARWCRLRVVALPLERAPQPAMAGPGPPDLAVAEWVGMVEDVHERRHLEESRLLMSREINHRARNLLAVVQAVVRLTAPPADPAAPGTASVLSARIAALARAHDLLAEHEWRGADMAEIARQELAAWLGGGPAMDPRVRISGPPVALAARAVQPLAMTLHELATNAAKHGALAAAEGRVTLTWQRDAETLRVVWTERGGAMREAEETGRRQGFGTRLVEASIGGQLGGRVDRQWPGDGFVCVLTLPLASVLAPETEPMGDPPSAASGVRGRGAGA